MHWQVLASGSEGNALLVRAGELNVLLDCGLGGRAISARLRDAGLAPLAAKSLHHVVLTHGHLDHARGAGVVARASRAAVHAPESCLQNRSLRGSRERRGVQPGTPLDLRPAHPSAPEVDTDFAILPVAVPHDADPTFAYRVQHADRVAVLITDMGRPCLEAAAQLHGAHLLQLEFNHDAGLLANGPYAPKLKERVAGDRGHLSNDQAVEMLRALAGPELHTLVLAHLSQTNNRPLIAVAAAREALSELGLDDVNVLVAPQHEIGPNLAV